MAASSEKCIKSLPKKETVWMRTVTDSGDVYYETSTADRTTYFLYQETSEGYRLLAKGKSPMAFRHLIEPPAPKTASRRKKEKDPHG